MVVTSLLYFVTWLHGGTPCLEQCLSSVMPKAPPMSTVLQFTGAERISISSRAYGGSTGKYFMFYTPAADMLMKLRRRHAPTDKPPDRLTVRHGPAFRKFTGVKSKLKASENYTAAMGNALAEAFYARCSLLTAAVHNRLV